MNFKSYLRESRRPKSKIMNELFVQFQEIVKLPAGNQRDREIMRLSMIAELDAVNLYENLAKQTTNATVKDLLLDIANEEKVHVGEFEAMLEELDPEWEKYEDEGEEEAADKFNIDIEEE